MCGIAGFLDLNHDTNSETGLSWLKQMTSPMARRGPDDEHWFFEPQSGLGLGFRRLAILDLKPTGRQPMASLDGRFTIVFNGEIYNFEQIRNQIMSSGQYPHRFRGSSDTEVLLAAISLWGIKKTIERANGMFAIALWDRDQKTLSLARDRYGEKPLYYFRSSRFVLFGSELKALRGHPGFQARIRPESLGYFFRYHYIPSPDSIYEDCHKVKPGELITFSGNEMTQQLYYSLEKEVVLARDCYQALSASDAINELESKLSQSIKMRLRSDVPLGAFLSGGIDSSTIVALASRLSPTTLKTFCIGFHDAEFDESEPARKVAQHLGTDHTELRFTEDNLLELVDDLPAFYDEPFADSSQLPTLLVSKLARTQVTVAITGDGGDELLGGYNRYTWQPRLWNTLRLLPLPIRLELQKQLEHLSSARIAGWYQRFSSLIPQRYAVSQAQNKIEKIISALGSSDAVDLHRALLAQHESPELLVKGLKLSHREASITMPTSLNLIEQMMLHDLIHYFPGDILTKLDRGTMAFSLEGRIPFLDPDVVHFAWGLPLSMKLKHGQGKWILRELLKRHVPQSYWNRPKTGFGVPVGAWLRGRLKGWADEKLSENALNRSGLIETPEIRRLWSEHVKGHRNHERPLWAALMFQSWFDAYHL